MRKALKLLSSVMGPAVTVKYEAEMFTFGYEVG